MNSAKLRMERERWKDRFVYAPLTIFGGGILIAWLTVSCLIGEPLFF